MAILVPLAQLTTAFPPITQVHPVCCPGISRLHLLRIASREIFLCPLQASLSLRFDTGLSSKIAASLISSGAVEAQGIR